MSNTQETRLVSQHGSVGDRVAAGIIAIGLGVFGAGWLILFQWISGETTVLGVSLFEALGFGLVAMGIGIGALGLAAQYGFVESTPAETTGLLTGVLFGGIGFVVGGLVVTYTFGFGTAGGLLGAAVVGTGTTAVTVLPREDLGSTVPSTALLVFAGSIVMTGIIDANWTWSPEALSVTFIGPAVIPILTIFMSLIGVWSAAKARGGFGARGRQSGSFLLISLSVFGMLAVLGLLVGFIIINGLNTVLTGADIGIGTLTIAQLGVTIPWLDVTVPFLTNVTQSLFVEISGVMPAIVGTVWLVVGAMIFAVPLGIGAAVFLTEYSESERIAQIVEVATNGLWSTPSIVFGLFGLAFLLPRISGGHKSLLGGQLVLGFMLLPLVVITSREAILAVPDEYRDASAALGVTQWQTIRSVVLPAAMPGIITGIILGVGRIAGETAPLLFVFGGSPFPNSALNVLGSFELSMTPPFVTNQALMQSGSALPYQLYTTITSGHVPGQAFTVTEFGWGTAFVLLLVVIVLYGIGIGLRLYFQRKLNYE